MPILRLGPPNDSFFSIDWPEELRIHSYLDLYKPIPVENPIFVFFWAALFAAALFQLNRHLKSTGPLKIQFYITDLWAGIFCLIPSYKFLPWLMVSDEAIVFRASGLMTLVGLSTAAGIWAALQLSAPLEGNSLPGRLSHAISVVGGGMLGWLGLFVSGFLFGLASGLFRALVPDSCYSIPAFSNVVSYVQLFDKIPIEDPLFCIYAVACLVFATFTLRRKLSGSEPFKFQFYISDLWAVALALVPAYGLLPIAISESGIDDIRALGLAVLTALCIACGCWAALLWLSASRAKNGTQSAGRLRRVFVILGCGLLGFLGLFAATSLYPIESAIHSVFRFIFTIVYYFPLLGFMGLLVGYLFKRSFNP